MDVFRENSITTLLGSPNAGKSYLIKYMISRDKKYFDYIIIISNTANFNNEYKYLSKLGKPYKICNAMNVDDKLKIIMKKQKKYRQNGVKSRILLVFDDIMGIVKDSKQIKVLMSMYRHYNITVLFTSQYIAQVPSYCRELSTYIILFKQRTERGLRLAYESYFQDINTFREFKALMKNKLQNHRFYVVDRKKQTRYICRAP